MDVEGFQMRRREDHGCAMSASSARTSQERERLSRDLEVPLMEEPLMVVD